MYLNQSEEIEALEKRLKEAESKTIVIRKPLGERMRDMEYTVEKSKGIVKVSAESVAVIALTVFLAALVVRGIMWLYAN